MEKNTKTIREMFNQIKANYDLTKEEIDFIDGRLAQLDKKAKKKSGELTETQKENIEIGNNVLAFMAGKKDLTIATIRKEFNLSPQKLTPIMKRLETEGKVTKVTEKRTSYYTVA